MVTLNLKGKTSGVFADSKVGYGTIQHESNKIFRGVADLEQKIEFLLGVSGIQI